MAVVYWHQVSLSLLCTSHVWNECPTEVNALQQTTDPKIFMPSARRKQLGNLIIK
jgi:hypothetical protein